jgi:hypothetical protein
MDRQPNLDRLEELIANADAMQTAFDRKKAAEKAQADRVRFNLGVIRKYDATKEARRAAKRAATRTRKRRARQARRLEAATA